MAGERPYVILLGYTVPDFVMEALLEVDPGMPVQTHRFAWSFVDALTLGGVDVQLVSTLLTTNYPKNHWLRVPSTRFESEGVVGRSVGFVNLLGVKHVNRLGGLAAAVRAVIRREGRPLAVLVHGTASPLVGAARSACRTSGIPVVPIITDIPNWRFSMGRPPASWLRRLDDALTYWLIESTDAVITLTEPLAHDFAPHLPSLILEGIAPVRLFEGIPEHRPAFLDKAWINVSYMGSLHEQYGVGALVESIGLVREERVHLHLFGKGRIGEEGGLPARVHYHGMVGRTEVAQVMTHSDALVNTRDPEMLFTQYSFPSKLLEYMLSGTPTLTTRLPAIPSEYETLLNWIESPTPSGIARDIDSLVASPLGEARARADRAREFVRNNRGPLAQGERISVFLNSLR